MRILSRKMKLVALFSVVLITAFLAVVNYTDACRLEKVTYNGEPLDDWRERFGVLREASVFRQPLDSLARELLAQEGIYNVDISYSWPRSLDIATNVFTPVCFVVDSGDGTLYGAERDGRLLPLERSVYDWECPIITGVTVEEVFGYCSDVRVKVVVEQLAQLRNDQPDFFRLLNEIYFGVPDYVEVYISGLTYRVRVRAGNFLSDLSRFADFITRYDPDLTGVELVDMRFDGMIVCARGKG
jgi:hypothetical protein